MTTSPAQGTPAPRETRILRLAVAVMLGLGRWMLGVSLLALAALGAWAYRHRDLDLWILIGTVSIAARFWMHHRWYDDLLMVLPMVTLFRLMKHRDPSRGDGTVVYLARYAQPQTVVELSR